MHVKLVLIAQMYTKPVLTVQNVHKTSCYNTTNLHKTSYNNTNVHKTSYNNTNIHKTSYNNTNVHKTCFFYYKCTQNQF